MCFVITIIGMVLGFNFFLAGNLLAASGSFVVSAFFAFLMIRNIQSVRKLKKEKKDDS